MAIEGRLKVFTDQHLWIWRPPHKRTALGYVIEFVARTGIFDRDKLIPDDELARALHSQPRPDVHTFGPGLWRWSGVVRVGSEAGFDLHGELRRATDEQTLLFAAGKLLG